MKIYSIKEIANATKNLLDSDTVSTHQKNNFKKQEEIPLENEKISNETVNNFHLLLYVWPWSTRDMEWPLQK